MRKLLTIILLLFSTIFTDTAVVISETQAQENETLFERFQNEKDAIKHKCIIVRLKDAKQKSCVLQKFEGHELKLIIYDANAQGEFKKDRELCIPSWYQKGKVKFLELLGDGKQFMSITFEGNTGTGTLQMVLMIIGWHDGKFVPVLVETADYYLMERDDIASLKMSYVIENIKTSKVTLHLKYKFIARDKNEYPFKFNAAWEEKLTWDEKNYSFYNEQAENRKYWNVPCFIQRNIANVRLSTKYLDTTKLCDNFFEKTKIMHILNKEID